MAMALTLAYSKSHLGFELPVSVGDWMRERAGRPAEPAVLACGHRTIVSFTVECVFHPMGDWHGRGNN